MSSLKNYRELAAIPDHTLVKWGRSKSMNDVFTGEDDTKNFNDTEAKSEMRRTVSYSDAKDAVDKEEREKGKMRGREVYTDAKDAGKKMNKGEMRQTARYRDAKDAGKEERDKNATRHTPRPLPISRDENKALIHAGKEGRSKGETRHTSKSYNRIPTNSLDEEGRNNETRHTARLVSVRSMSGDEVNDVQNKATTHKPPHLLTTSSSSRHESEGEGRVSSNDGVFVATPIFLEGSPSSSPPPSPPSPSAVHQGGHTREAGQGTLKRESDSAALSTLRREILHLTRLKEEIELNLIKGQAELKQQVAGLREERGGLEAVMDEREKCLHAQEEEIKDLKDTIAQLQTLVFASDGEARLQRQASDLQEQLREEKRQHMEETRQLWREVRALTSRLQEKEEQLEKYMSDPALNSWGSGRLEKAAAGTWKTSLPDVRKELASTSLGASRAERRRSFSSTSDCSDDGNFSTTSSFIFRASRAKKDVSSQSNGSAMRTYITPGPSGKSDIAPGSDLLHAVTVTARKFEAPEGDARLRGASVRSGKAVESSGKPNIAALSDSRLNGALTRTNTATEHYGETDKTLAGEGRLWGAPERLNKPVEASRKPNIVPVSDSRFHRATTPFEETDKVLVGETRLWGAPRRPDKAVDVSRNSSIPATGDSNPYSLLSLETPLESRYTDRKPTKERGRDVMYGKPSVATLDLAPGLLTAPLGDVKLSSDPDGAKRNQANGETTRMKTTVYVELGDYTRSGGGGGGGGDAGRHKDRDYVSVGGGGEVGGWREEKHGRLGGGEEECDSSGGYYRGQEYGRAGHRDRDNARSGHNRGLHTSAPPVHHIPPRPSAPPPPPPEPTSVMTTSHHAPPPSPQVTRSFVVPSRVVTGGQVTQEPSMYIESQSTHPVRSSGGVDVGLRTAWMYKPVEGTGGVPVEEKWRRDSQLPGGVENRRRNNVEVQRGVSYGRRETGTQRGVENGRMGETESQRRVEYGRRGAQENRRGGGGGTESQRAVEQETRNSETQRIVNGRRRPDSALINNNMRASSMGEAREGTQATSYITATMHCLYSISPLRHFFTADFRGLGVRSEVAKAVSGVFGALESGARDERGMEHLQEAVGRRDKIFLLHQDPPAVDFLSCLLAWLHSDLTPETHPRTHSVISRLFHGLRESLIVCPASGKVLSTAMESFNYLTLSVPGEGAWTLQELLTRRFEAQEMAWKCQLCGFRHSCTHQPRLVQPPRVLLVYLRRPSFGAVAARVLFPEAGLVLHLHSQHQRHQQLSEARTLRSPKYELVGMVTREMGDGSSVSHHSAFCRRLEEGGSWEVWRKQSVAAVSRREVLSQQAAHLLFYIQQEE